MWWRLAFIAYAAFVSFLLLTPHPLQVLGLAKYSDSLSTGRGQHAIIFAGLALFGAGSRWPISRTSLVSLLAGYAVVTEGLQAFIPARNPDWADVAENLVGIAVGLAVCAVWMRIERRRGAAKSL